MFLMKNNLIIYGILISLYLLWTEAIIFSRFGYPKMLNISNLIKTPTLF